MADDTAPFIELPIPEDWNKPLIPPLAPLETLPVPPEWAKPAPLPAAPPPGDDAAKAANPCETGTLELTVNDAHGDPIPHLALRVLDITGRNRYDAAFSDPDRFPTLFSGNTDAQGKIPAIAGLAIDTIFEIQVKKDSGKYKLGGIGKISGPSNTACLKSPKIKFEFSTEQHDGAAGSANKKKEAVIQSHNQIPEPLPNVSRNPPGIKPSLQTDRNSAGNPKLVVKDGLPNMFGQHDNQPAAPHAGKTDLEKVKALIAAATEQVKWEYPGEMTSAGIIDKMKDGTFQTIARVKGDGLGYQSSNHRCNKYVKIALWRGGYSHNNGDIGPSISAASEMGPALVRAGFTDVTGQLPDARWAAPGDVIVYQNLTGSKTTGHIDIRSYDGYISDFLETYLPVTHFKVIGIYRKYYDPLPELRMRAFLKVLRSRESARVMTTYGDQMTYQTLPDPGARGTAPPMFENFDTHPFYGKNVKGTASGAYGIVLDTWKNFTDPKTNPKPWIQLPEHVQRFTPIIQDRIAIAIMETCPTNFITKNGGNTALSYIRKGEIENAVNLLKKTWTSLPGAGESRKYTMEQLKADYLKYLAEIN